MSDLHSLQNSLLTVNARLMTVEFADSSAMARTANELEKRYGNGRAP